MNEEDVVNAIIGTLLFGTQSHCHIDTLRNAPLQNQRDTQNQTCPKQKILQKRVSVKDAGNRPGMATVSYNCPYSAVHL